MCYPYFAAMDMTEYVISRASAVKTYKTVARDSGIGERAWEWLKKLANREIENPGARRIEKLYKFYKLQEVSQKRKSR
jgi:hypothetical protein